MWVNFKQVESGQISVFNKVKLDQLGGINFGQIKPDTKSNIEQLTLLIDGQFYKMVKHTVSTEQLKHGDLIHYIITAENEIILCNESRHDDILETLSNREQQVLVLLAEGYSMNRIAKMLFLSPHTVDSHRVNLCKKLEVKRLTELAVWAHKLGLLNEPLSQSKNSN